MAALGAEISHALAARGVEVVFGIPGVHNIEMYRGLESAGLRHVLARHEGGAGFMADGYARATGRPGVAYVITGPGLTNILTPLGQAWSDSVPVLALASCLDRADLNMGRGRLHDMPDQAGAAAGVVPFSHVAASPAAAWDLIDRAMAGFAAARPRPAVIHLPLDLLAADAPAAPAPVALPARPLPDAQAVMQAAQMLSTARRPLVIVGGGATGASGPVREVVSALGAAVIPTMAGRGVVAGDWPLCFGPILAEPVAAEICASADLVLVLGSELAEPDLWREALGHGAPMIRVDIDPASLADRHRADLPVLADVAGFAAALLPHLGEARSQWGRDEISRARARVQAAAEAARPGVPAICQAVVSALPDDAVIYSDMTQFAYVATTLCDRQHPGRWHHPCGYGTLGYALPAAIGGKIGLPDAPVVAMAGDYGFQYTIQELATAAELGLSLPIILWDNARLAEIEDYMRSAQFEPVAVWAKNPDFALLAQAYGAGFAQPPDVPALRAALADAFAHPGPTLIRITPDFQA